MITELAKIEVITEQWFSAKVTCFAALCVPPGMRMKAPYVTVKTAAEEFSKKNLFISMPSSFVDRFFTEFIFSQN